MNFNEEVLGAASGALAGVINAIAVGPLDVVKARQQIQKRLLTQGTAHAQQQHLRYNGTFHSLSTIYKEEGMRGFYRGFSPTLLGYAPTWAVYFTLYNFGRKHYAKHFPNASPSLGTMLSAVMSGAVSNVFSNPIWVIRARLQTQEHVGVKPEYDNMMDCVKKMYKREGFLSFYKGLVPATMTLIHVAIQFPLYERLKHEFISDPNPEKFSVDHAVRLILASSMSKLSASVITYPLEVVRTRMQVQRLDLINTGGTVYLSVHGSLQTIIREEGIRGLYSGIQTNLIRVVPACAVTFTSYELLFRSFKAWNTPPSSSLDE